MQNLGRVWLMVGSLSHNGPLLCCEKMNAVVLSDDDVVVVVVVYCCFLIKPLST